MDEEFARAYGEGDRTLDRWRSEMGTRYRTSAARRGENFSEDTLISCEWIGVLRRLSQPALDREFRDGYSGQAQVPDRVQILIQYRWIRRHNLTRKPIECKANDFRCYQEIMRLARQLCFYRFRSTEGTSPQMQLRRMFEPDREHDGLLDRAAGGKQAMVG